MKQILTTILYTLFILTISACSSTDSENVKTDGIYAVFNVIEQEGQSEARATFYVGGETGTVLNLSPSDTVTVNGQKMIESKDLIGKIIYKSAVTPQPNYTFTFKREGEDTYESVVTLPPPASIISPDQGSRFTRGQPIQVQWVPGDQSNDEIRVTLTGSGDSSHSQGQTTIIRSSGSQKDDGSYIIPGSDTSPESITGAIREVSIEVKRIRPGSMAKGLNGYVISTSKDEVFGLSIEP